MLMSSSDLAVYVGRQLDSMFPVAEVPASELRVYVDAALERLEVCFSALHLKYFQEEGASRFDPLHTDQYAMFLWYLGNAVWRLRGDERLAARVYALNKALHAVDIFHEVELPDIWCLQHPVGAVLGRASYGDYFCFYQGCLGRPLLGAASCSLVAPQ